MFEHLSPQVTVTFCVNSLPPVKMLLIRPPWTKSAEDLALVVPDTHSGRTLLAAYRWYMAGHAKGDCVPEPIMPVHHRDILQYLFVAGQHMSLDGLLSVMTREDLERLGEYPDLSEEELKAEKDLLRKHVPDGTHVTAYVNNTQLAGIIQDGRFMTQNSQMVHSAVFVFWAGGSHGLNPHDVIWIHTKSGSQPLADYLKTKTKTKTENEVVHATVATIATVTPVATAVPAQAIIVTQPQQLLNAARARTTELQLELGLWKLIQTQHELNKALEATLTNLKATLVPLRI